MGVITLALVAHGSLSPHQRHRSGVGGDPVGHGHLAGTYAGGWRIIRTVGSRIIRMDSAQALSAQASGAAVILISSHLGYPLSSTHVISGGVMGAGAAKRLSAVRWGAAGTIAAAWVITLPTAGCSEPPPMGSLRCSARARSDRCSSPWSPSPARSR
jgi:inorganic phosphate transporter, PiT family